MKISLPEQVWIDFEPATFGSRAIAYGLDAAIRWGSIGLLALFGFLLISILPSNNGIFVTIVDLIRHSDSITIALVVFGAFLIEWSYPVYFEVWGGGATPGKRLMGLSVVDERGLPLTLRASFLRNALTVVDFAPMLGTIALFSMLLTKRSQRLGDLVARTMVVHLVTAEELRQTPSGTSERYMLPLPLYNALDSFIARYSNFSAEALAATTAALAMALEKALPSAPPAPAETEHRVGWLHAILKQAAPAKHSASAPRRDRQLDWKKIRTEINEARSAVKELEQRRAQLQAADVTNIARRYQQLCQRYAYLSTFYPNTREALTSARLVRTGRSLIYGTRLQKRNQLKAPWLDRLRHSFRAIVPHVSLAFGIAIVSALLAAVLVQLNPNLGWSFLNEAVVADLQKGKLWTENIRGMSSVASSKILTNNISVSISVFAMGITWGIGTVLILILNGVHLGGIFSALTDYQMATPLLTFIAAHGFIELSVIFVSAGCGLYLADGLIHPGDLTRKRALQVNASQVVDILLLNAACLVLAGIVEGYISPYEEIPWFVKLGVGLTLGLGYWWALIGSQRTSSLKLDVFSS